MSNSKVFSVVGIICLAVCGIVLAGPSLCPDLSPNDKVDFADFAILADNWLKSGSGLSGDLNGNGTVDIDDLKQLCDWWLEDYECKSADFISTIRLTFLITPNLPTYG